MEPEAHEVPESVPFHSTTWLHPPLSQQNLGYPPVMLNFGTCAFPFAKGQSLRKHQWSHMSMQKAQPCSGKKGRKQLWHANDQQGDLFLVHQSHDPCFPYQTGAWGPGIVRHLVEGHLYFKIFTFIYEDRKVEMEVTACNKEARQTRKGPGLLFTTVCCL